MTAIDPQQTHQLAEFKHEKPLTTVRVDPTGAFAFAGAEDNAIHRWNLKTGEKVSLTGHESWVRSLNFSPDGGQLYSAGWDGQLRWWDALAAQPTSQRMVQAHQGFNRWVDVSPDGARLATCGNDNRVRIWDAREGGRLKEFEGHLRHPYAVVFHPRQQRLASEDLVGEVCVWDYASGGLESRLDASIMTGYDNKFAADMGGARDMQFSPDGQTLACAGITNVVNAFAGVQDPIVVLIDWAGQRITHHLRPADKTTGIAWGVRFHPSGWIIGAVARQNGKGELLFWRPARHRPPSESSEDALAPLDVKPLHILALKSPARGMDLVARGSNAAGEPRRLAVAHADGALRIYQMTRKRQPPAEKT